jgi:hypothetical protein
MIGQCHPMLERLVEQAGRLRRWYSTHRTHVVFRLLQGTLQLGMLAVSAWYIWDRSSAGYTTISAADFSLDPRRLIVSWLCITASTALGAWEWVLLVNALGGQLDIIPGMRIHLVSNLAKYVPGFIWSYVGKAYLATRQGVPAGIAALSVVCEFIIVFSDGGLVLALCLPYSGIVPWSAGLRLTFQLGAILLAGTSIVGVATAGRWLVSRSERIGVVQDLLNMANWSQVTLVIGAVLLTWCLLGFGFSALNGQPSPNAWQDMLRHTFALVSALLIGQAAIFAPTGIGIREAVLVALLSSGNSTALIVVTALVFRIEMMIGEVFCASIAWLVDKARVISPNNPKG